MTILTTLPNGVSLKDFRDTVNAILGDVALLKSGTGTPTPTPSPTLAALTLAASSIPENSASGTVIGGLLGRTSSSTLALVDTLGGKFALSGTNLVAGATSTDYETATSHQVTVRETLAGATNSPRDTVLTIGVTNVNEQPNLSALILTGAGSLKNGTTATGAISGATAGSTITASGLPAGFTINGPARTWSFDGTTAAGSTNATLTETLGDSANSPRQSAITITIAAAPAQPTGLIFLATGDSKLVGNPREAQDVAWPNVYNYRSRAPVGVTADIPFDQGIARDSENRLSLMEYMAKKVAEDTGLPVYVVSHGWNGTKVAAANTSSSEWGVGNGMHETFIDRLNGTGNYAGIGAIKAILAARPGAVVAGLIRVLGTNDALSAAGTFTQAAWRDRVLAEDADYKARIFANGESGAKIGNVPTYFLGLLPETLSAARTSSGPAVELANREAAATIVGGRYFPMVRGYSTDNLHETPAGIRIAGTELAKLRADTTPAILSSPDTYSIYSGQRFAMELKADRYAWFSVSGPDAGLFEVTWYTETEDAGVGGANYHFVLRFKNDVAKSYASPDDANLDRVYDINVVAKTGAGIVTTKRLLLTVEQAFGTASTGAPVVTAMGGSAETRNLFSPSTIGGVNFGRGLNLLSFLSNPSLQQFTSIRVNGQDAVMLKASTSGDPISVWAVPIATPGTYQVDLKFDGVNVTTQFANALVTNVKPTPTATDFLNFGYRSGSDLTYTTPSISCPAGGVIVELAAGELNSVGAGTTLVAANNAAHHLTTRTSTGSITINAKLGFGSFTFAFERAPTA